MERGNTSLQDIMNVVSARLDHEPVQPRKHDILDELQAFLLLDPLLASLNKQYLDAKMSRLQAQKDYGAFDGMTEMAALMEDSAWCAMQTRYMEVRADRGLRNKANKMVEESRHEVDERLRKEKEEETWRYVKAMQMMLRMREEDRRSMTGWWIVLMMYFSQPRPMFRDHHNSYRFNMLAA